MTHSERDRDDDTSLTLSIGLPAEGDEWVVLCADGEIDISTAAEFDQSLKAALASSSRVIVDLSGVRFMDSTGLGVLMDAQGHADPAGLRLAAVPDRVERLFSITKLDTVFSIYPSVAAARNGVLG